MDTKLRIVPGLGQPFEIERDVAEGYRGPARQVVRRIIEDHIHDPDLLRMLDDKEVALEQFTEGDSDADGHEALVTANTDWSEIVQALQAQTVELGLARTHKGGLPYKDMGHRCGEVTHAIQWVREEDQRMVQHPAGYLLTQDDEARVIRGTDVFISGRALAKAELICRQLGGSEGMWYWTSEQATPALITDLIIPEQRATAGMCATAGVDVLKVNRLARKQGHRVVAAGHSHGRSGVFSSITDRRLMHYLAAERVGHASVASRAIAGRIRTAEPPHAPGSPPAATGPAPTNLAPAQVFQVDFPDAATSRVRISTRRSDIAAGDLLVELVSELRALSVTFSTHNADGAHYFPVERARVCPTCGIREEVIHLAREVTLHVVGPRELSAEERAALAKEVKEKVEHGFAWGGKWGSAWTDPEGQGYLEYEYGEPCETGYYRAEPGATEDFEIRQRGSLVGRVSGAVLEEAAYKVPALAAALGWAEYTSRGEQEVRDDGSTKPDTR